MAIGFVHDIQALIAFGYTYHEVNRKKDAAAARIPGLRHRRLRHGWYRAFGRRWDFAEPFPDAVKRRTQRIFDMTGPTRAEEYMVSVSHDYLDRIWDFDGLSREDRRFARKYWEAFHLYLVLNPKVLKDWAGVDVVAGRIHRLVDGQETWEDAPQVKPEYQRLRARAYFLLRLDRALRHMLAQYGEFACVGSKLSNKRLKPTAAKQR